MYRLLLALIGLAALGIVMWTTAHTFDHPVQEGAAAWTRGGAVTVTVLGLFGLLRSLAQAKP